MDKTIRHQIRPKIERIIRNNRKIPFMAFYDSFSGDPLEPIVINSKKLWEPPTVSDTKETERQIATKIQKSIDDNLNVISDVLDIKIKQTSKETGVYYLLSSDWDETIILLMDSSFGRIVIAVAGKQDELAAIINKVIKEFYYAEQEHNVILVANTSEPDVIKMFQDTTTRTVPNLILKLGFSKG